MLKSSNQRVNMEQINIAKEELTIVKSSRLKVNDPAYLTSVTAHDRPDILEEMKEGKHRSVRAAAIKAETLCDNWHLH